MHKPILISISPNTDKTDLAIALKTVFTPFTWQTGPALKKLENQLKNYFNIKNCFLLLSGRSALYLALKSLNLKRESQVLCQAFTCVAVPNAIKWAGLKPVFVDTQKNSSRISLKDLNQKITPQTKALIVQHNFGLPDDLQAIRQICRRHQIFLIEDCAQSLGVKYKGKPVGSLADLTVLSFGRDKVISSVWGGAVLTSKPQIAKRLEKLTQKLTYPSQKWILIQLLHPVLLFLATPFYFRPAIGKYSLGKGLIFLFQKLRLITPPVSALEKKSQKPLKAVQKYPHALAVLAVNQFQKLQKTNQHRIQIASLYLKNLKKYSFDLQPQTYPIYLRFPILVENPQKLIKKALKKHIMLGNWYRPIISPQKVQADKIGYQKGSCPNAEKLSAKVVNLPTHIKVNPRQALQIIKLVKNH